MELDRSAAIALHSC